MTDQPTASELLRFREWYADFHGVQPTERSVFVTCLCGHFHTYTKAVASILRDLKKLGLIETRGGTVRVLAKDGAT